MAIRNWHYRSALLSLSPLVLCLATGLHGQGQISAAGQKTEQAGKAIRVGVGLVQTDVMVFDRENRFVENLRPEQFELKVDGIVQPISFFELVSTGTAHDEEIWAKAEGKPAPAAPRPATAASDAGRAILFFIDDWHLSADSLHRSRAALATLIDKSMGPRDRAALVTASGQLGFLQQLTDNKGVLQAALQRFNLQSEGIEDKVWEGHQGLAVGLAGCKVAQHAKQAL